MEKIKYEFAEINISEIQESEINPQQMKESDFDRLVKNISRDGSLTSTVLLMKTIEGKLKCLSGHHRIRAARKAGLKKVPSMIIENVDKSTQYRLQLAHNDIHGEPDMKLAALLIKELEQWDLDLIGKYEDTYTEDWIDIKKQEEYSYINICLMPESANVLEELIMQMDWEEAKCLIIGKNDFKRLESLLTEAFKKGFKTPGKAFRSFLDIIEGAKVK